MTDQVGIGEADGCASASEPLLYRGYESSVSLMADSHRIIVGRTAGTFGADVCVRLRPVLHSRPQPNAARPPGRELAATRAARLTAA